MMLGASTRKWDQDSRAVVRFAPLERLKRIATNAWEISFVSFAVTALVFQAPRLTLA